MTAATIARPGTAASGLADAHRKNSAVRIAVKARTEPTDRSMPPVMMTSVAPRATMPM